MSHPEFSNDQMKEFMQESLNQMCQQLTHVVDDRLALMKRQLSADNCATLDALANKKSRVEKPQFKSKGNEQQFDHQLKILDVVDGAATAIESQQVDKALSLLQDGKSEIESRMKLIKLADQSEHGWQMVTEYISNELADNSDDEKRMNRAERAAERKAKKAKAAKSKSRSFRFPTSTPCPNTMVGHRRPAFNNRYSASSNQLGPCYKLSIHIPVFQ